MLENNVKELRALAAEHRNTVYEMEDKIKCFPKQEQELADKESCLKTLTAEFNQAAIDSKKNASQNVNISYGMSLLLIYENALNALNQGI